ncbi:hypothetical protein GCM10010123_14650 [Pilimelia anulata]|uniref:Ricin B lectin domain-containing protein n=1 Tax=Pilimelia anulata TaxID=53371 RepID=A0A8J3B4V0_9ACTN|nr:RICIN domain-containing protein [Pilimelia anulata]GGJ86127.1 hypothetical protein GCM10010123_14650 [Pilimelia anulata]
MPVRQVAPPSVRPRRPVRRARRRRHHGRLVVIGTVLGFAVTLAVAPDLLGVRTAPPRPVGAAPPDNPRLGLVYRELTPAGERAPCVGGYEVTDRRTCTAGPDPAPPGVDPAGTVPPIRPAAPVPALPARDDAPPPRARELLAEVGALAPDDAAPGLASDGAFGLRDGLACRDDGRAGRRVQVLYAYEGSSRFARYRESFRAWGLAAQSRVREAADSGPVRFVTTGDCRLDVREVALPAGALRTFTRTVAALRAAGYDRTDRKYLLFADAHTYCSIATAAADADKRGPAYGRVDAGCWGAPVAARQLTAVLTATGAAGDVAGSAFVVRDAAAGAAPIPAGPASTPRPTPAPTLPSPPPGPAPTGSAGAAARPRTPAPEPTATPTASLGRAVRAADTGPTGTTLSWPAGPRGVRYTVLVDGKAIAATTATAVRLVGLRADREYDVRVWVPERGSTLRPHTDPLALRVPPAPAPPATGATGLVDALTGGAAELAAGRPGGPVLLGGAETLAAQTWKLRPAAGTAVQLVAADGRCLTPRGGAVAGAVLVTAPCAGERAQQWRLRRTPSGVAVTSAAAPLVLGIASARFGDARLLTLQEDRDFRSQRWLPTPPA